MEGLVLGGIGSMGVGVVVFLVVSNIVAFLFLYLEIEFWLTLVHQHSKQFN